MLDFITDLYSGFGDSVIDTIIVILFSLLVLIVIALIIWGVYIAIDSLFRPDFENDGIITDKQFTAAHTQIIMVYNVATKVSMPQTIYHPDKWEIRIQIGDNFGNASIKKEFYNSVKINDCLLVKYSTGRLNKNNIYIKSMTR